jgi:1-acyl-sn-glycerol-3-phosphate acyltransferase
MKLFYKVARRVLYMTYLALYHHKVEWEINPKEIQGGAIIAPNHVSYLDPQLVCASWPGDLSFFAGSRLFKHLFMGCLLRLLCCHPVEKGKELATIRTAISLLKEGKKVVVFPEGTRSDDGDLKPFHNGVAFLALQSHCPIIPCYVGGSYDAWPRSRKWPRFRGVRTFCRFGRPILPLDANGKPVAKETLNKLLYEAISRLSAF